MSTYDTAVAVSNQLAAAVQKLDNSLGGKAISIADSAAIYQVEATQVLGLAVLALVEEVHKLRVSKPGGRA